MLGGYNVKDIIRGSVAGTMYQFVREHGRLKHHPALPSEAQLRTLKTTTQEVET